MENLLLSFRVVAPLMIYIGVGMLLRRTGVAEERDFRVISRVIFYVALPALCFSSIIDADFSSVFGDPYMLYLIAGILVTFLLCVLLVPRFCADNRRRSVIVQSIFRSNDGVFGLAVALSLMGAQNMGLMSIGVALSVPLFNVLGALDMELFRGGRVRVGEIVHKVFTNPIVIACALAMAFNLLHVRLPEVLGDTLTKIAGVSAPMGFLALGGVLSFASVRKNVRALGAISLLRLIIAPVVFVGIFYLLGYRGDHLLVALIIFGAPTAMTTYTMACAMGGDEELASGAVAITSLLSIVTMFLFIFLLKELGVA